MRKRTLAWILATACAFSIALSGCSGGTSAGKTPAAPSAPTGAPAETQSAVPAVVKELRIGTTSSIDGFNIMKENGIFGKLNYNGVCTAPFVVTDSEGVVQPYFMTSWELSDDLNTLTGTFATDQGINWHDGEPVTVDDVVFTFNYLA